MAGGTLVLLALAFAAGVITPVPELARLTWAPAPAATVVPAADAVKSSCMDIYADYPMTPAMKISDIEASRFAMPGASHPR